MDMMMRFRVMSAKAVCCLAGIWAATAVLFLVAERLALR
jgi:hypothetical protein